LYIFLKILLLDLIVWVFFDNLTVMKSKNRLEHAFSGQEVAQSAEQQLQFMQLLLPLISFVRNSPNSVVHDFSSVSSSFDA